MSVHNNGTRAHNNALRVGNNAVRVHINATRVGNNALSVHIVIRGFGGKNLRFGREQGRFHADSLGLCLVGARVAWVMGRVL